MKTLKNYNEFLNELNEKKKKDVAKTAGKKVAVQNDLDKESCEDVDDNSTKERSNLSTT